MGFVLDASVTACWAFQDEVWHLSLVAALGNIGCGDLFVLQGLFR